MRSRDCVRERNLIQDREQLELIKEMTQLPEYRDLLESACRVAARDKDANYMLESLQSGRGYDRMVSETNMPLYQRDDFYAIRARCLYAFYILMAVCEGEF